MRAVVLCHTSELALVVLRALRVNGVVPYVACEPRIEKVIAFSRACARVFYSGPLSRTEGDLAAVTQAVARLHREVGIDVVMASNVQGLRILHDIRHAMPAPVYPMPPLDALDVLDDKRKFYDLAANLDVPVPRSMEFETAQAIDVDRVSRDLGYPVAVKPAVSWASVGFLKVGSERELSDLTMPGQYPFRRVLVQEFIEGDDVGAGLFVRRGEPLTIATFKCGPRDAAEFVPIPALVQAAERIVDATGCEGVINFDARLSQSGEFRVLECNPRFFMRLRAARLCGLDFLRMGLPASGNNSGRAQGCYRPVGDAVSSAGLRQLVSGEWPLGVFARTVAELAGDPLPTLLSRLGSGRTRLPPAEA